MTFCSNRKQNNIRSIISRFWIFNLWIYTYFRTVQYWNFHFFFSWPWPRSGAAWPLLLPGRWPSEGSEAGEGVAEIWTLHSFRKTVKKAPFLKRFPHFLNGPLFVRDGQIATHHSLNGSLSCEVKETVNF